MVARFRFLWRDSWCTKSTEMNILSSEEIKLRKIRTLLTLTPIMTRFKKWSCLLKEKLTQMSQKWTISQGSSKLSHCQTPSQRRRRERKKKSTLHLKIVTTNMTSSVSPQSTQFMTTTHMAMLLPMASPFHVASMTKMLLMRLLKSQRRRS